MIDYFHDVHEYIYIYIYRIQLSEKDITQKSTDLSYSYMYLNPLPRPSTKTRASTGFGQRDYPYFWRVTSTSPTAWPRLSLKLVCSTMAESMSS